jgi:hypothetical protein
MTGFTKMWPGVMRKQYKPEEIVAQQLQRRVPIPVRDGIAAQGWRCLMSAAGERGQWAVVGECRL